MACVDVPNLAMVIMGVLKYLMGYTLTVKRYALANYCPHNLSEFYMTAFNFNFDRTEPKVPLN